MERGYDLLISNNDSKKLQDLPKIKLNATGDDRFAITNLKVHRADSEEDALNLLFIGHTNRVITDTPENHVSTRSHCIFVINIES